MLNRAMVTEGITIQLILTRRKKRIATRITKRSAMMSEMKPFISFANESTPIRASPRHGMRILRSFWRIYQYSWLHGISKSYSRKKLPQKHTPTAKRIRFLASKSKSPTHIIGNGDIAERNAKI